MVLAQTRTTTLTTVAGVSLNVHISCSINDELTVARTNVFWMINGLVYGILHTPSEFRLCNEIACLIIPVVQGEMDRFIFQCFHIDHQQNTVLLGGVTMLEVLSISFNSKYVLYVASTS